MRYSFTTEVSSLGKTPSSTLVDFGVVIPTRAICQRMDLQEGTHVYCFTRIRNVDGEPLILETSYYPQYIYPNLTREMVQTHSFYSLLYHVGITPFSAEDTYESVILDAPRASLLGVEPAAVPFTISAAPAPRMAAFMSTHAAISAATGPSGRTHAEKRHELQPHHRLNDQPLRPRPEGLIYVRSFPGSVRGSRYFFIEHVQNQVVQAC